MDCTIKVEKEREDLKMKWQKCPICEGRGFVMAGFYTTLPGCQSYSTNTSEICRTCYGTGTILEAPDWPNIKTDETEKI